jgi:hypothetical protein
MPHLVLNYDINDMYQITVDVLNGLWPIIAAAVAIGLVTMLLAGIMWVFRFWRESS